MNKRYSLPTFQKVNLEKTLRQLSGVFKLAQFSFLLYTEPNSQWKNVSRFIYMWMKPIHFILILSFADILAEVRKYGVSFFLAHQYVEQLQGEVRTAIFGNVGTLICFRVGVDDAEYLEKEFEPLFDNNDLVKLPKWGFI